MSSKNRKRVMHVLALWIAAVLAVQSVCSITGMRAVKAGEKMSAVEQLLTDYCPQVEESVNTKSGFTHPGVGLTKEMLNTVQSMVRAGEEPWTSYFEDMLESASASRTPSVKMTNPADTAFNSQGINSRYIADALTAYTQAVLYYVTGDNVYRKNALYIIRQYEQLNPDSYAYFNDAHIHTGIPTNRMCIAAEIIRYSSYQVTDGFTAEELQWTDDDTDRFIHNLVKPMVEVFQSSPDHFMNQHLYTLIGAMSGYLFMDDAQGYARSVEWFTVNKNARDQGFNGSIKRLFREITTVDEVGQKEGSGRRLETPVIQHMEMGRDQAHGCGDLTNTAILARLMQAQGTKVDPVEGTVSEAEDGVDVYSFLDNRILEAADFFFRYMLGYDAEWIQAPFAITQDGIIKDNYAGFSPSYRGRYSTINFWDLYTYYTYVNPGSGVDLVKDYPYFYEGFMKKMPSNYYHNGGLSVNWNNVDGGGDFWLFLPPQAKGDSRLLAEEQTDYRVEIEDRGSMVANKEAMSIQEDNGVEYIRFVPSAKESRVSVTSGGTGGRTIALRIRTDGMAQLCLSGGVEGRLYLPDTRGAWEYVTFTRENEEGFGDLYYVAVSEIAGSYVDIDAIDIKPSENLEARSAIDIVEYESGSGDFGLVTYVNAPFSMTFTATGSLEENKITYSGIGLPEGALVDSASGMVKWTPERAGNYSFYIAAKANETTAVKKLDITVGQDRTHAISQAIADYSRQEIYTSVSLDHFRKVLGETEELKQSGSDEVFAVKLNELCTAVAQLELVSPLLAEDTLTQGDSLDYRKMIYNSNMDQEYYNWADGNPGSFVGYYKAVDKADYIDFGPDFKVSAYKFGFQARMGFSDRLAGVQVFGSNDNINWIKLTVGEAPYTQAFSTVETEPELRSERYRYLMIKKTTEYADVLSNEKQNLLEFGEFRIWGIRYETGNMIDSISMSCAAQENGRIKIGDTVTLTVRTRGPISSLTAMIQGREADVVQTEENVWTASAVMSSGCSTGTIFCTLDYTKPDGSSGDTFYGTTDGSSLFLVNSDIYIDTAALAEQITATSGSWDGKLTAQQCAALLFDQDTTTFGDLKNTEGDYYTVDFGEGVSVALTEVMLMPRSTAQNHADRLNGTIISGSDDGENWTQITPAVTGAVMGEWSRITEKSLLDRNAYRYFKISGASQGDIAEVEFYGTYMADPERIASRITGLEEQLPSQTQLRWPLIPAGYTIAVKESSHPWIVSLDGRITTPQDDTTVTLKFTVTADVSGKSADTQPVGVLIKGMSSLIGRISIPEKGAACLTLPQVPKGYEVSVEASSDPGVIALGDGKITMPEYDTLVEIELKLIRTADQAQASLGPVPVLIYGQKESQKIDVAATAQVMASCAQWGNGASAQEVGYFLFDGSPDTYGDLLDGDGYYTVDFGENGTILPVAFRLLPRGGGKNGVEYVGRMNGTVIEGSMDGIVWEAITEPFHDSKAFEFYTIPAEEFIRYGKYRYFKISGAASGNIAELEIHGMLQTSAADIAKGIGGTMDVTAAETCITFPAVPTGYEIAVASSSDERVIAMDGSVNVPEEDTQVILTFVVTGFGQQAVSGEVTVMVQGMAGMVTGLRTPQAGAQSLVMPSVPEGFVLSIVSSSDTDVVALDGAITTPQEDTLVDITLKLARSNGGPEKIFPAQTILIYGMSYHTPVAVGEKAVVISTNDPYDGHYTRETIGALLVDGDLGTFGDLKGNGAYIIDFGEQAVVRPDMVRLYPRNTKADHIDRLNGTYMSGSNDGINWVQITKTVENAVDAWQEFTAEDFLSYGEFRYFKLEGGTGGNIAEFELYGVYSKTAAETAATEPGKSVSGADAV